MFKSTELANIGRAHYIPAMYHAWQSCDDGASEAAWPKDDLQATR
jgi:uncharacterized protein (DUF779 family)